MRQTYDRNWKIVLDDPAADEGERRLSSEPRETTERPDVHSRRRLVVVNDSSGSVASLESANDKQTDSLENSSGDPAAHRERTGWRFSQCLKLVAPRKPRKGSRRSSTPGVHVEDGRESAADKTDIWQRGWGGETVRGRSRRKYASH
jgi:hypothetical protein